MSHNFRWLESNVTKIAFLNRDNGIYYFDFQPSKMKLILVLTQNDHQFNIRLQ